MLSGLNLNFQHFEVLLVIYLTGVSGFLLGNKALRLAGVFLINKSLNGVSSYFFGMTLLLGLLHVLMVIFGFKVSVYLLLSASFWLLFEVVRDESLKINLRSSVVFVITLAAFQLFVMLFWTREVIDGAYSSAGSGHSPRYGNLALYILECDCLPVIGQNYGQSIFAAIPGVFGVNYPLFALNIFLGLNAFLIALLGYVVLKAARASALIAAAGVVVLMVGNTALSFSHIMVSDFLSPFIVSAYGDFFISMGVFVPVALLMRNTSSEYVTKSNIFVSSILMFFVYVSWTITAPQNFYLVFFVFVAFLMECLKNKIHKNYFGFCALNFVFFILAIMLSRHYGGMFVDTTFISAMPFSGMQTVSKDGVDPLRVSLGIPMVVGSFFDWQAGIKVGSSTALIIIKSLMSIFWPAIGLVIANVLSIKKVIVYPYVFLRCVNFSFVFSVLFVFLFEIYGAKWELSRFAAPAYFYGMIFLVASISRLASCYINHVKLSIRSALCLFLVVASFVLICYGPLTSILGYFAYQISNGDKVVKINAILNKNNGFY